METERTYLTDLMAHTEGNIATAIEHSGLSRARFYALLKKYGIATTIRPNSTQ
jgi:transcriptional regulator of acetoin/glycerol metabolism